jgi:hypothetical protein
MLMRAPLVKAEQNGSIRIQDLTKVVMARGRLGLAKKPLVPFEAARNVAYADDCPDAFHEMRSNEKEMFASSYFLQVAAVSHPALRQWVS